MKTAKLAFRVFKIAVVILSIAYIAVKLFNEKQSGVLFGQFNNLGFSSIVKIVIVIMLIPFNWGIESLKFKVLIKPIQNIPFVLSMKAVLAGITVSIFTPKRIGDFGGRVFALESNNRVAGVFATILGNYSQLIITIIAGLFFIPFYFTENHELSTLVENKNIFFLTIAVVIIAALLVFFNIPLIGSKLLQFKFFKKYSQIIAFVKQYNNSSLAKILVLSLVRYFIFSLQMYFLLNAFGGSISMLNSFIGTSQVYLYLSFIPTIALGELGARGSMSIWVLNVYGLSTSTILAASVMLWSLNLALPALIGIYFLWKFKY